MGSHLSIAEALAQLEAQVAHHRKQLEHHETQEAHYARQQAFHAEQKLVHETELRKATERFEAFKTVSADIGPVLVDVKPAAPPPAPVDEKISTRGWGWLSRLMERVIAGKKPGEVFGASGLIDEIYRRWGEQVRHVEPRSVSSTLRRWGAMGRLRIVRNGRSYSESLYTAAEEA